MSEISNTRIKWIDTAKGIGLLFVILGHLHLPYASMWIYTFHMPLFFFLSGAVFSGSKYNLKEFVGRRIKSLVIPYFVLGSVIYAFWAVTYAIQGKPLSEYIVMLGEFLKQEHFWTVWFLACLFIVEVMYYLIYRLLSGNKLYLSIASICICIIGFARYRMGFDSLPWNIDVALIAQFFFHIGHSFKLGIGLQQKLFTKNKLMALILIGVFFVVNALAGMLCIKYSGESLDMSIGMYGNEILTLISALAGIMMVVIISNKIENKIFTYLGQNTMILFAWHSRIIIVLCGYIYSYFGIFQDGSFTEQIFYGVITFVVIFAILVPINELIKKSKMHSLFGV